MNAWHLHVCRYFNDGSRQNAIGSCFLYSHRDGAGHHPAQGCAPRTTVESATRTNWAASHRITALARRLASPEPSRTCDEVWPAHVFAPGPSTVIVASSPETAMEFLHTQGANSSSRPPYRAGEVLFDGQDILSLNATPVWRQLRTIIKTGLVGPKRLEATREVRAEEVGHLIRTLPQKCTIELRAYLIMMLNNIFSRLVNNRRLSIRGGEKRGADEETLVATKEFKEIMEEMAHCIHSSYLGDYIPGLKWFDLQGLEKRFKHTKDRMDSFALKVINEHEAERKLGTVVEEKDLVDKLLDEVEKTDAKHQITMANVKAVMWDGFFGGKDPILGGIEWAMSEVLRKPEMVAKAQAELDLVVRQHRCIQESDLPNLVYIQAIVSETMRLHPGIGTEVLAMQYCFASLLHAFEWVDVSKDPDMAERAGLVIGRALPLKVIVMPRLAFRSYT